ncbi:MerR family transcriptional regulator [Halanaerobium sp.]|jgi:MerR family glutamine synthetase transcriptional repressor|uniref:MerR family transcriptional regulator n=1 Tax=Halanaerobium sp. TaxID=1895664 RepID=UPI000DE6B536|nr:MerR family transcriptional regulator [Halanaerobium sp.]PUU89746.1 MAG: MerR family transcriptional regulator, glutamine synthetase repressor [Halanaerobium sp.]PUU90617.1 MAG: MerR family transcriptional regulator, glutamine synthetase repressor [Halanaerobium sp.]
MKKGKNITMKEAKEKTGLTSRQIRYYDQQELIFPARSKGNQRLFSASDIKRLLKIKELLTAGNSIETVRSKLKAPLTVDKDLEVDDDFDDNYDYYSDVDLDSLYPVSNRSELIKKLSRSNKKHSQKEED